MAEVYAANEPVGTIIIQSFGRLVNTFELIRVGGEMDSNLKYPNPQQL